MSTALIRRATRLVLGAVVAVVTLIQVLRPGLNQDLRYVLGALDTTSATGLHWTEVWAHRPLLARGIVALLDALSPGEFWVREAGIRAWSVALAAGAAVLLWRGLRSRTDPPVAGWAALAVGASLAWAPGWDFAEPEWYATVLAVAALGLGLGTRWSAGAWLAGVLLALTAGVKYTTLATALAAWVIIAAFDRRAAGRSAVTAILTGAAGSALAVLIEPRVWQWSVDMPLLNPPFRLSGLLPVGEGLVNSMVVSPITLVALVAVWGLLVRGGQGRRLALVSLLVLVLLTGPFVIQQQNFLYHLAAVPVAAAGLVAAIAARSPALPGALALTGLLGLVGGVGLFGIGPRTRDQNWWVADVVLGIALAAGLVALVVQLRRGLPTPRAQTPPVTRARGKTLIAIACLAPLLVTLSPRTAYSFSLAHNRVTAGDNRAQALTGPARRAAANAALPAGTPVVYLSFSAPYWLGYPTHCPYASPTFLQRATGARSDAVARTESFAENLACLSDSRAAAVVIEPGWFDLSRVRPEVRTAVQHHFDCGQPVYADDGWLICPRR